MAIISESRFAAVIITGGELLTEKIRKNLQTGSVAMYRRIIPAPRQEISRVSVPGGHLHINEDRVIVEPVAKDNKSAGYGARSDIVLITIIIHYLFYFTQHYDPLEPVHHRL